MVFVKTEKQAREVTPGSGARTTAYAVEPIGRGVTVALQIQSNEDLFDQESVIENDVRGGGHLLIGEVRVFDLPDANFVQE